MPVSKETYLQLITELSEKRVTLVAVSKTKPVEDILELYHLGHRDFGENYVQEMVEKAVQLPKDIHWHFIGHLQTNKVKLITPFTHLIHGVDSLKLLKEINKQGEKNNRIINCLLQMHIAQEETKFGLDEKELKELLGGSMVDLLNVNICGLMGMASLTTNMDQVRTEFKYLRRLFDKLPAPDADASGQHTDIHSRHSGLPILSMGMSSDYRIAIEEGSNMVRIGSLIFGERG